MSHGQEKPQNGQGNVREKSGNFVRAHGWTPCIGIGYLTKTQQNMNIVPMIPGIYSKGPFY